MGSDGAVQRVTLDHETLPGALSVRLENIDRLDRVLLLSSRVDSLDGEHGVDSEGCEKVVVADVFSMTLGQDGRFKQG